MSVPVAAPAALVGCKLHAAAYRKNPAKYSSDLFDLCRLLEVFDTVGGVAAALVASPAPLGRLCNEVADELLGASLTRSLYRLAGSQDAVIASTADRLEDVGQRLRRGLHQA